MNLKCRYHLLCVPAALSGCQFWHAGLPHSLVCLRPNGAAFGPASFDFDFGILGLCFTQTDLLDGKMCRYSVISWLSFKLQRVARSLRRAEAQAFSAEAQAMAASNSIF